MLSKYVIAFSRHRGQLDKWWAHSLGGATLIRKSNCKLEVKPLLSHIAWSSKLPSRKLESLKAVRIPLHICLAVIFFLQKKNLAESHLQHIKGSNLIVCIIAFSLYL